MTDKSQTKTSPLQVGDTIEYCEGIQMTVVDRDGDWFRFGRETSPVGVTTWASGEEKHIDTVEMLLENGWELVLNE